VPDCHTLPQPDTELRLRSPAGEHQVNASDNIIGTYGVRGRLRRALGELAVTIERTATVVAQARSRLAGQMPDGATRLVSLHDPDARPIRKGRIDKPVEFGYKA
jgi:hypothetical protein